MKKLLTLIVVLILASSAFTQNLDTIDWMLELHEKLNLSKAQVDRLMTIRLDLKKEFVISNSKDEILEIELKELKRNTEKNLDEIKKKFHEVAFVQVNKNYSELVAEAKALKMLNEDQKKELFTATEQWHKQIRKKKIITYEGGERISEDDHIIIKKRKESTVHELKEEGLHEHEEDIDMYEGFEEIEDLKHAIRRIAELEQRIKKLEHELQEERAKKK